jgi:PDZ domain-containing protein
VDSTVPSARRPPHTSCAVDDYILLPGQALNVDPMIAIKGHPPAHKAGRLMMTDVTLYKADHLLEELYFGRLNSNADIQPATDVSGGLSSSQFNQYNVQLMSGSIQSAEVAALNTLPRYKPHFAKTGPKLVFLVPHLPAEKVLKLGDVIEAVDGHRTLRAVEISPLARRGKPGRKVHLKILRRGSVLMVNVGTVASKNGTSDKRGKTPLMGIVVQDQIVLPIKISVSPGDIGGPSAGLMFSLGIIQRLSPQDLTRGCKIAGTGTIDNAGVVGAIGGAKQKIVAARGAGARYFLVPDVPDNAGPARAHRGNVTVVPVKTLRQALTFLKALKPCR